MYPMRRKNEGFILARSRRIYPGCTKHANGHSAGQWIAFYSLTERDGMGRLTVSMLLAMMLLGCRSPEANLQRYLRKGKEFAAKKDYARAMLEFRNACQSMPTAAEPYYQLGMVDTAMGNTASASQLLSRAVKLDPKHVDALLALAELLTRSTQSAAVEEGKRLAEQALAIVPANTRALNVMALADLRSGNTETAAAQLKHLLQSHPDDTVTTINLARVLLAENDPRGAEKLLRNAALKGTPDATAAFALADFYLIRANTPDAAEWYERGLDIQPDNSQALAALGRLYVRTGREQDADRVFARLAQNPDGRFRYAYAFRLSTSGRKNAAVAEFARIFKANPEDRTARTHLIDAYLDAGQLEAAERLIANAISRDATDIDALIRRAGLQLSRGEVDAAAADLQMVLQFRPDSADAHELIARVYRFRYNEGLEQRELSEALRLDPRHVAARVALSQSLISSNPERALTLIDSAPEDVRESRPLRIQRIWPLIELKRFQEARTDIDLLLPSGGTEVLLQDAVLCMRQSHFTAARASAQKVLSINPGDVRALELILRSAVGEKQTPQGLEFIRRHAAQHRDVPAVQIFLGNSEWQMGNAMQARAAFEAAKAASPSNTDADWSLIDLDIMERKFDDARRRIAPLMHGSTQARATAKLALLEQNAGNYQVASRHYRTVLEVKPSDPSILNALAYILSEFMGNPAEALAFAQRAQDLAPENAAVNDTLGWTYYQLRRYAEAVRYLELSAQRGPSALRYAHLAMAYVRSGDEARAKQALRAAMKLNPDLPEMAMARQMVADNQRSQTQ